MLAALAASHGSATLTTTGPAAESLRAQGVKVPAKLALPVTAGTVSRSATLDMGKRLTLRRGKRSVTLSRWQARLGTRATLTARVAGRRIVVLRGRAKGLQLDAGTRSARLRGAALTLDRGAARVVKRRLGLRRAPQGRLGRMTIRAALQGAPPARPLTPSGGGGGTTPGGGGGTTNAAARRRPPPHADPPRGRGRRCQRDDHLARPRVVRRLHQQRRWAPRPRTARRRTRPTTSTSRSRAAGGTGDATRAVYYTGRVNFRFPSHGIDMQAEDPEIELNGADSRAIFRMDGKREVLIKLHPDQAVSHTTSPDGKTITYEQIPGTVPEGTGDSVFAGFYLPGDEFGWVSVRFSTA